ncbi:hypothetical protein SFRURICE_017925 [Spodoptera frugiperda]|nr:hypothetical protein SFRURICE_017925 [Spodoptera frugiperda]
MESAKLCFLYGRMRAMFFYYQYVAYASFASFSECTVAASGGSEWKCDEDPCMISDEVLRNMYAMDACYECELWMASLLSIRRMGELCIFLAQLHSLVSVGTELNLHIFAGTLPLSRETARLGPIIYDKDIPYPPQFDARQHWKNYISPVTRNNNLWITQRVTSCGNPTHYTLNGSRLPRHRVDSAASQSHYSYVTSSI